MNIQETVKWAEATSRDVLKLLKVRFPNLSTEESYELTTKIVDACLQNNIKFWKEN